MKPNTMLAQATPQGGMPPAALDVPEKASASEECRGFVSPVEFNTRKAA